MNILNKKAYILIFTYAFVLFLLCNNYIYKDLMNYRNEQKILGEQNNKENTDKLIAQQVNDSMIYKYVIGKESSDQQFFKKMNQAAQLYNIVIREIPSVLVEESVGFSFYNYRIILEGSYINLVRALIFTENSTDMGRVSYIKFQSQQDILTKRKSLTMELHIYKVKIPS
jgi:hypothetical protein